MVVQIYVIIVEVMKKVNFFAGLLLALVIVVLAGWYLYFNVYPRTGANDETHYHAGFVLFDGGKQVSFTDLKYMHVRPCSEGHEANADEDEQIEKAHLHDFVGDVAHVHRSGAVWGDLFKNINYDVDGKKIRGFVNGEEEQDILKYPIKAYDSVVFFKDGKTDKKLVKTKVSKKHILEVEDKSENCGDDV